MTLYKRTGAFADLVYSQADFDDFIDELKMLSVSKQQLIYTLLSGQLNQKTPVFCEHANENPAICPCKEACYCKSNTCAEVPAEFTIVADARTERLLIVDTLYKAAASYEKSGFPDRGTTLRWHAASIDNCDHRRIR